MSKLSVQQWRRLVFASQDERMSPAVKVLCLFLADHMNERDRKVSLPRDRVATALGVHEARVTERLTKAVEAGFLSRVSRGFRGRTAVYQGTRPDSDSERQSGHLSERKRTAPPAALRVRRAVTFPDDAERESRGKRTALLAANTEADLLVRPTGGDVGNDENPEDRPAAYGLTACDCHGKPDCITLAHHLREESA